MKKLLLSLVLLATLVSCSTPEDTNRKSYNITMEGSNNVFISVKKNGRYIQTNVSDDRVLTIDHAVSGDVIDVKTCSADGQDYGFQLYINPDDGSETIWSLIYNQEDYTFILD